MGASNELPRNFPKPAKSVDSAPFWDACKEGHLVIQCCAACGTFRHPPGPICAACGSNQITWKNSAGTGEVFSYVIVEHAVDASLRDQVPYNVVVVRLDDCGQVLLTSNVLNIAPEALKVGMRVKLQPDDVGGGVVLPRFVAA